jgi:hypothetical protein
MLSVLVLLARVVTAVAKAVLETLVTLVTLVVMVLLVLLPTRVPLVVVAKRATLVAGQHGSGG